MKKILFGFGFCLVSVAGFSQQLFQQTQFMVNPYTVNPALAGSEDFVDIKAGYRTQWVGFDDSDGYIKGPIAPRTTYLSAHSALGHDHGYYKDPRHEHKAFHGIGGFIASDQIGAFSTNSIYGSYSYNMSLIKGKSNGQKYGFNGKERHIGVRMILGTHVGMVQQNIDPSKLVDYQQMTNNGFDPVITEKVGTVNGWSPDASVGMWIYSNNYYVGAAVRRILANDVKLGSDFPTFDLTRHFNLMGGYKFMMSDFLLFEPSFNSKIEPGAKPSIDLNGMLVYDNTYTNSRGAASHKNKDLHIYTGITYRPNAAIAMIIGGVVERKYEITYSFDLTTNRINPYQSGTHEVTIGYRIQPKSSFHTAEDKLNHKGIKHH